MGLSEIEKEPFIFCRHNLVTPVTRFGLVPNICAKNGQRISMIAIAGDHFPTRVAAGEEDRKYERDSAPPIEMCQRSCCSHRPMGGLCRLNRCRRTAHRAVATKTAFR